MPELKFLGARTLPVHGSLSGFDFAARAEVVRFRSALTICFSHAG